MLSSQEKPLMQLDGYPLIAYSLDVFEKTPLVKEVILVVPTGKEPFYKKNIVQMFGYKKVTKIVEGGARRQDSVLNGLKAASDQALIIAVHDAARPFLTQELLRQSVDSAARSGACVVGVPCKATIKETDEKQIVVRTPLRDRLWEIQTPQTFRKEILRAAFDHAEKNNLDVTDEAMLVEALGKPVLVIRGEYENIKITTPEDLLLGEMILKRRKEKV